MSILTVILIIPGCTDMGPSSESDLLSDWQLVGRAGNTTFREAIDFVDSEDAGKSWACCQPTGTLAIQVVSFSEQERGLAAADGGILGTADGGRTWTRALDARGQVMVDLCFLDSTHGWAVTFQGDVYRYRQP